MRLKSWPELRLETIGLATPLELERVPDPAQRSGPEEKLTVYKTSTL